ncbi:hypothetical protein GCM10007160_37790 [Litchfieldella qijiaojingensis]|uniref:Glycosyltransferase n=1 Tax=Litchfieldella qijiaojingensis TaxID=980347 RepID=A0ABQ2Z717_9GAMM|nr:ATP-grasp fold amidoligase family protein [Halomonas qijiaojingensis]GGY06665.1 hypothetical protein GCM10007160_37790 [Halomonas qijiaojingensis]
MEKFSLKFFRNILNIVPYTRFGDAIYYYIKFYRAHSRLPKDNSCLINDYFFKIKSSSEIERVLRQLSSDKYLVKYFVESMLGKDFVPVTYCLLTSEEDVKNFVADHPCVIKPTHLSGCVYFKKPGERLAESECNSLCDSLKKNLYFLRRERNYKNLTPAIIVEEQVDNSKSIRDYKVFCYKGSPRFIQVDSERHFSHKRNLYTTDWEFLDVTYNKPVGDVIPPPKNLESILEAAKVLSSKFESARIDFFIVGDKFYVGEITHVPEQAHGRFQSVNDERLISEIYFNV